mmetsp:Transcript_22741/g.43202  ORF Transcript_22741/g.43202 Transcript_22741/m.43202 type:complete len:477 (+) Transcript_22741:2381-3811(+)
MSRNVLRTCEHVVYKQKGIQTQGLAGTFTVQRHLGSTLQEDLYMLENRGYLGLPANTSGGLAQSRQERQCSRLGSFFALLRTKNLFASFDEFGCIYASEVNHSFSVRHGLLHCKRQNTRSSGVNRYFQEPGETFNYADAAIFFPFLKAVDQGRGHDRRLATANRILRRPQKRRIVFFGLHHSLESTDGRTTDLPAFIVVVIIKIFVLFVFIFVLVFIVKFFVLVFFVLIFSIRVVRVITHVCQRSLNDFFQMRLDFLRAAGDKRFEPHETRLAQFCCNFSIPFVHDIVAIIMVIVVVSRSGIFRIRKSQKDGDDPVNLFLSQTVSNLSRDGAHGADQRSRISNNMVSTLSAFGGRRLATSFFANAFGLVNLSKQGFYHSHQQGVRQYNGQTRHGTSRSFSDNWCRAAKLRQAHLQDCLVLASYRHGRPAKASQKFGQNIQTRQDYFFVLRRSDPFQQTSYQALRNLISHGRRNSFD